MEFQFLAPTVLLYREVGPAGETAHRIYYADTGVDRDALPAEVAQANPERWEATKRREPYLVMPWLREEAR